MKPYFWRFCTTVYSEPQLILMVLSLPRVRSICAISYGYIGCCASSDRSASASKLLTFRRFAISGAPPACVLCLATRRRVLVAEDSLRGTRRRVYADEA